MALNDEDPAFDLDGDPLLSALSRLPKEDLDASRSERIRMRAHRALRAAVAEHDARPSRQLARAYDQVIEPALVLAYGAFTLSRAAMAILTVLRHTP